VMTIYNLIDDAQERANQLLRYRTPDDISPTVVAALAQSYLTACQYARSVLPKMRTGSAQSDDKDPDFFEKIDDATKTWENETRQIKETGA
jgi:hypothetical protein